MKLDLKTITHCHRRTHGLQYSPPVPPPPKKSPKHEFPYYDIE